MLHAVHTNPHTSPHTNPHTSPHEKPEAARALLHHPKLWRAGQLRRLRSAAPGISTGYAALDAELPGGGWPGAGLAEVLHAEPGLGELRLLAPALAELTDVQNRWVAWIRPPAIPYAPALGRFGMRSDRMLMVHPRQHADALWAAEQAARSGTCSAVLVWLDEGRLTPRETRRLQVAARQGGSFTCLFRSPAAARQASAAELRLALAAKPPELGQVGLGQVGMGQVRVDVLKRRGGWAVSDIELTLAGADPIQQRTEVMEQLALWRDAQPAAAPARQRPAAQTVQPASMMAPARPTAAPAPH